MSKVKKTKWSGRNFMITLNQVGNFVDLKEYLSHFSSFNYAVATKEKAPQTGHEHIHVFCQYSYPVCLRGDMLYGSHIEKCFGSAQKNIAYVKKLEEPEKRGEIIWEEGQPKYKGGFSIEEVKKMPMEERIKLPFVYYKSVELINMKEENHLSLDELFKEVEVRYIYGSSGLGKTFYAKEWMRELGMKKIDVLSFSNGFWNGVSDEVPFALFDEFRDASVPGVEFIKLIDYTVKIFNIKGGSVKNRYRYIAITSIQDPRFIYEKEWEESRQWLRRMKVIQFFDYRQWKLLTEEELFK